MTFTKHLQIIAVTVLLCASNSVFPQVKSEKYYKESAELRATVWAWDRPEFKVREVPADYSKASKVVIAHHTELTADSKNKVKYYGLSFATRKELSIIEIVRELVKVNDKVAIDYYSELAFSVFQKKSSLYKKDNVTTYVGVRIIKPDGQVREVNADEMVLTRDGRKEKEGKLAIPDLQVGDLIDYFIATDLVMTNDFSSREYSVVLFDDAPTMHNSFHAQLGKRFAIDYRSYNGAPDLKVTRNEDDDIVIDVVKKNMAAFETTLWIAPAVQLPFIRMNITLGTKKGRADFAKAGEVNKNKSIDEILRERSRTFAFGYLSNGEEQAEVIKLAKKKAKASGLDLMQMSDEERAAYLYYVLRFTKIMNLDIEDMQRSIHSGDYNFSGLSTYMYKLMWKGNVKSAVLISSTRDGFRMNEAMDENDLRGTAFVGEQNKFVDVSSIYSVPFEIPEDIEGMVVSKTFKASKANSATEATIERMTEQGPGFKVPVSPASANAHLEKLAITITPGETKVDVKRNTTIKGHYKLTTQRSLILYEDFYESERKLLGEEMGLLDKLGESKKGRKYVDEVRNALAEERKKQKDAFQEDSKSWFEQEITDLKDYKIESMGVRHTSPDLIYRSAFKMDGLVKKAGNNIIFEIGKIQASPLTIKPEQRKRDLDVFMSFARSIEYEVAVKVPDGYSVEGLDALNRNVTNETGAFIAAATLEGDVVKLKVQRRYNNSYVPSANWDKLVAFIDVGSEWSNSKILFKKK